MTTLKQDNYNHYSLNDNNEYEVPLDLGVWQGGKQIRIPDYKAIKEIYDGGGVNTVNETAFLQWEGWEMELLADDVRSDYCFSLGECKFVDLSDGSKGALVLVRVNDMPEEEYTEEPNYE